MFLWSDSHRTSHHGRIWCCCCQVLTQCYTGCCCHRYYCLHHRTQLFPPLWTLWTSYPSLLDWYRSLWIHSLVESCTPQILGSIQIGAHPSGGGGVHAGSMGCCKDRPTSPTRWRGMILGGHQPTSLNGGEGPRWGGGHNNGDGGGERQDQQCSTWLIVFRWCPGII